jgi:hypothetical protein
MQLCSIENGTMHVSKAWFACTKAASPLDAVALLVHAVHVHLRSSKQSALPVA